MSFLLVSLVLLVVSVIGLLVLNSYDHEKVSLLNQYWNALSLGIGILLLFIGLIYLLIFIGLVVGKFSITLPHLIAVAVLYVPAAIVLLVWLLLKIGFEITPTEKFLNILTYIAVSWVLMEHIEITIKPTLTYAEFGIISLIVSIMIFAAAISIFRYRSRMKVHLLLPIDLHPLLNGVFVTFTFISLAGISASLGKFFTHVFSCLVGALVIVYFVTSFMASVRVYLK